jgi:voltage-gated potassium channel
LTWRRWAYQNLHTSGWRKPGISPVNRFIALMILAAVVMAILQTEPEVVDGHQLFFRRLEIVFACIFLVEYVARVWCAPENPDLKGRPWQARLRYMVTLPAIIDLLALSTLFLTLFGSEGAFLRLFRLVRIFMLARLGRYSTALKAVAQAVNSRRYELVASLSIAAMLLLVSSTLLYTVEGPHQPDDFGSIPRAMWWSIATLTTVGYGDVFPVTPIGKILAGITAITGIGLIAMPTGILAAAFSDAIQSQREESQVLKEARLAKREALEAQQDAREAEDDAREAERDARAAELRALRDDD